MNSPLGYVDPSGFASKEESDANTKNYDWFMDYVNYMYLGIPYKNTVNNVGYSSSAVSYASSNKSPSEKRIRSVKASGGDRLGQGSPASSDANVNATPGGQSAPGTCVFACIARILNELGYESCITDLELLNNFRAACPDLPSVDIENLGMSREDIETYLIPYLNMHYPGIVASVKSISPNTREGYTRGQSIATFANALDSGGYAVAPFVVKREYSLSKNEFVLITHAHLLRRSPNDKDAIDEWDPEKGMTLGYISPEGVLSAFIGSGYEIRDSPYIIVIKLKKVITQ